MVGVFVSIPFDAREGHPVVACDDDQGVVEFAAAFEFGEYPAQVAVGVLNFEGVVEQVVPHCLVIGPIPGHAIDVRRFLAAEASAATGLISTMRFNGASPEKPRLIGPSILQEGSEVGRVVVSRYSRGSRFGFRFVVDLAGIRAAFALGVEHTAGSPDFAGRGVEVAAGGQGLGEDAVFWREDTLMVSGGPQLPRVAPGHDRRARRGALRGRCVGVGVEQAFARDAIEVRRLNPGATIRTGMTVAPVVHDEEEDIRTLRFRGRQSGTRGQEPCQQGSHGETLGDSWPIARLTAGLRATRA